MPPAPSHPTISYGPIDVPVAMVMDTPPAHCEKPAKSLAISRDLAAARPGSYSTTWREHAGRAHEETSGGSAADRSRSRRLQRVEPCCAVSDSASDPG